MPSAGQTNSPSSETYLMIPGEWMKPTSKLSELGSIYIERWIQRAIRWIFILSAKRDALFGTTVLSENPKRSSYPSTNAAYPSAVDDLKASEQL